MSVESQQQFLHFMEEFSRLGMDLGTHMDRWAEERRAQLESAGVRYPQEGDLEEKWAALQEGTGKNSITPQTLVETMRRRVRTSDRPS